MKKILLGAAMALGLMATGASAATLDFLTEANYERGLTNGSSLIMDGVNVTFTSNYHAYFDKGAGLGVCKNLRANLTCKPNSDDNITSMEWVTIAFDNALTLTDMIFRAEGHGILNDARTLLFSINGGALATYTFAQLSALTFTNVTSATYAFDDFNPQMPFGSADQFYLSSAVALVPLPAGGLLLLGGLGGLAALRRRKSV